MITSEIGKSRILSKITLCAAVITVGMVTAFNGETKAMAETKKINTERCMGIDESGNQVQVGWGNTCESGASSCKDNQCLSA